MKYLKQLRKFILAQGVTKKYWHKLWCHKRYLIIFSMMIFCFLAYCFISLARVSFERLTLKIIEKNFTEQPDYPCHESCQEELAKQKDSLAKALNSDKRLRDDIINYFVISNTNNKPPLIFYQFILQVIASSENYGETPSFLIDYLANKEGDSQIKALIVRYFLTPLDHVGLIDYYLAILTSDESSAMKLEALHALNNLAQSGSACTNKSLNIYQELALSLELSFDLRLESAFLVAACYPSNAPLVIEILRLIYLESNNIFLQALAGEYLSTWQIDGFLVPEISDLDWEQQFN